MTEGLGGARQERRPILKRVARILIPVWFIYMVVSIPFAVMFIVNDPALGPWFWTSVWINYALIAFSTWFIATDRRLPRAQQYTWAAVALCTGALGAVAYWWIHLKGSTSRSQVDDS